MSIPISLTFRQFLHPGPSYVSDLSYYLLLIFVILCFNFVMIVENVNLSLHFESLLKYKWSIVKNSYDGTTLYCETHLRVVFTTIEVCSKCSLDRMGAASLTNLIIHAATNLYKFLSYHIFFCNAVRSIIILSEIRIEFSILSVP